MQEIVIPGSINKKFSRGACPRIPLGRSEFCHTIYLYTVRIEVCASVARCLCEIIFVESRSRVANTDPPVSSLHVRRPLPAYVV